MRVDWDGINSLANALEKKSRTDFKEVTRKNLLQMRDRGVSKSTASLGGTPRDTGELRLSMGVSGDLVGYTKSYSPHVEFGHRQNVGQFIPKLGKRLVKPYVPGQYFLKRNRDIQAPIYKKDLERVLESHD